jgi:hypothetical protein
MNFIKILKFLLIIEVIVKKISFQIQNILSNLNFSIICVNHQEQHNEG